MTRMTRINADQLATFSRWLADKNRMIPLCCRHDDQLLMLSVPLRLVSEWHDEARSKLATMERAIVAEYGSLAAATDVPREYIAVMHNASIAGAVYEAIQSTRR